MTNKRSKLIKLRKEKGFTQEDVARLLQITRSTYANYETGYRKPDIETVIKLKRIFGVSEDRFFLPDSDTKRISTNV